MRVVHPADLPRGRARPRPRRRAAILGVVAIIVAMAIGVAGLGFSVFGPAAMAQDDRSAALAASLRKAGKPGTGAAAQAIVAETGLGADALKKMTADEARAANALIASAADVGPAAQPLLVPFGDGKGYVRALDCMTAAIYYEAATEPLDGQRAVAQVVLNRVRHFSYPKSVCGVVFQGAERKTGCQFSFTCDGSLRRQPSYSGWQNARRVASAALSGLVYSPVGLATHYHADYVLPYWAPTLVRQVVLGHHIFYRWPGSWGKTASFETRYAASEPDVWAQMHLAAAPETPEGVDPLQVEDGQLAAVTTARPILDFGGSAPAIMPAAQPQAPGHVDLSSQHGQAAAAPPVEQQPVRRTAITGGVIMPGAHRAPPPPTPQQAAP